MTSETRIRVRYAETDQMGHAYYANYLVWLEVARTDWCRARGYPYKEMEADGILLPVVDVQISYKREVLYDEELCIVTSPGTIRRSSFSFVYELRRGDTLCATATTWHVVLGRNRKPQAISGRMREILDAEPEKT